MLARLSFTDFDGQNFMNQTQNGEKIDDNLILKLAPKIVEGVDKLKKMVNININTSYTYPLNYCLI